MKLILILLTVFLTGLARAELGMTIEEVQAKHPEYSMYDQKPMNDRVKVYVMHNNSLQVGLLVLDGKVAEEIFSHYDGSELDYRDVVAYMKLYSPQWIPAYFQNESVSAAQSTDGQFFALYGPAEYIHAQHALRVFTKSWVTYTRTLAQQTPL